MVVGGWKENLSPKPFPLAYLKRKKIMKNMWVANDGTMFDDFASCVIHERDEKISDYDKIFVNGIKRRAENVISMFKTGCVLYEAENEREYNDLLRRGNINNGLDGLGLVGADGGIVYLRDDGVEAIIDYVARLEKQVEDLKRKVGKNV